MKFSQKSKFKASRMTKIADFDLLILPNLILCEICASESENLESVTLLKGEFSQNIKIKDIQNDQNCSFIPNFTWNLSVTKWKLQISLPRTVGHFTKRTLFMLLLTFMVWYLSNDLLWLSWAFQKRLIFVLNVHLSSIDPTPRHINQFCDEAISLLSTDK